MKFKFDYYHNLEGVDLYLCNPDGRELYALPGKNRHIRLRFNDLSELTFDVDSKTTLSLGATIDLEAYDYIQTKRLVYATDIGWFRITHIEESDNGTVKYKSITAESYQSVLKDKGFISEERVYCFYNPNDPYDERYDDSNDASIPSVVGQWSQQLGIKQDIRQGLSEPAQPYDDWTVTYISPDLIYSGAGSTCRTFTSNTTYGYDWIVKDVEDAFEVVVLFDFMYKTIHVMRPDEVAKKVNVIYTFNNFMKSVKVSENADDVVTVLNCNGNNCDITPVNPTGTNYICDFSYFMDDINHRWMSSALINKLNQWKADCDSERGTYIESVSRLQACWSVRTHYQSELKLASLSLQDLKNAQTKRSVLGDGVAGALCGAVTAERVESGNTSITSDSEFHYTVFTGSSTVTAYQSRPDYDPEAKTWTFSGASKTGTANEIVADNLSGGNSEELGYWYFSDTSEGTSYCKLTSSASVNVESTTGDYYCGGFDRYIAYSYPVVDEETHKTIYTDTVQQWIDLHERRVSQLNANVSSLDDSIQAINLTLESISSRLNIISYFSNTPALLRELSCYWIEGDYTNDNIAVLDSTTPTEAIDLSNELMEAGRLELSKACQPRYSFSLESINALRQYEFREQMSVLELGKIITIEKEEGLWYYPALLEIYMSLDYADSFELTFANALRLDDWGFTYADLISDASSTSRKISANWQEILAYSKEREEISSLIKDPLDTTLRASFANMVNQEFTVDKNGILGRKKLSEDSDEFENEQLRVINNLLIFTDDNWATAKTALGKIYYKDDEDKIVTSYGLVAETIIGSLIMSEKLKIKNKKSTIEIGEKGITIKREDGTIVFQASPDGSLTVYNYASQSEVEEIEGRVTTAEASIKVNAGQIELKASKSVVDNLAGRVTGAETLIQQNADEILLRASKTDFDALVGRVESAETSISQTADQIKLKASKTELDTLTGRVESAESSIEQNSQSISAKVSETYGDSASSFGWSLMSSGFDIYSNGSTVFKVSPSGAYINGEVVATSGEIGNMTITGTLYFGGNDGYYIDANYDDGQYYVNLPGLRIDEANGAVFSGALSAAKGTFTGSLSAATGTFAGELSAATGTFEGKVSFGDGTYYIDATAEQEYVNLPGLRITDSEHVVITSGNIGGLNIANNSIYYIQTSYNGGNSGIYIGTDGIGLGGGAFYVDSSGALYASSGEIGGWSISTDGLYGSDSYWNITLGLSGLSCGAGTGGGSVSWYYVYGAAKEYYNNQTSDLRLKTDIEVLPEQYDALFDSLKPVRYKYVNGTSGRYHTGFIAQDIVESLSEVGLTTTDLAAVCLEQEGTAYERWFLRRDELVALNTRQIQMLKKRVSELENIITELSNKLEA